MHSLLSHAFCRCLLALALSSSLAEAELTPVITGQDLTPGGKQRFTITSSSDCYHVLWRSSGLGPEATSRPVSMVIGADNSVSLTDSVRSTRQAFYQIKTHIDTNRGSADSDGDHVAGIMTEIPQTPLSHINLKAKQNNTPNAYIKDASTHPDIAPFLGQNVYYRVDADGFEIRAATQQEVDDWLDSIRPTDPQFPVRNLRSKLIKSLDDVTFEESNAFGAKAANVAELGRILPQNTPSGFAVPFYFYDQFMKHNGFYDEAAALIFDPLFQTYPSIREARLTGFRDLIKDGEVPEWMAEALDAMHQSLSGISVRARSSTNNEDLAGFNGAGLYCSYTHHLDEGHFQKTAKQVWASLWNYRAYEEREFWRIDHYTAAMGILVHPNYSNERANGVGVTTNIFDPRWSGHYINVQVGEYLITNMTNHCANAGISSIDPWTP